MIPQGNIDRLKRTVENICSKGKDIILSRPGTKNEFGDIITPNTIPMKAFPVRHSPFTREVNRRISWADSCDVICYVPKTILNTLDKGIQYLRRYDTLKIAKDNNSKWDIYEVKHISFERDILGDFLYIAIGGVEKK